MIHRSLTDQRIIDELIAGRKWLFSEASSRKLLSALRRELQSITRNVYVFRYIPEQCEEIYDLLIDGTTVARIEIPRDDRRGEIIFEKWSVDEYLKMPKTLEKITRRKLQLAIELSQRENHGDRA
jgi:hypothetical protein